MGEKTFAKNSRAQRPFLLAVGAKKCDLEKSGMSNKIPVKFCLGLKINLLRVTKEGFSTKRCFGEKTSLCPRMSLDFMKNRGSNSKRENVANVSENKKQTSWVNSL